MKKLITILLVLAMAINLVACSKGNKETTGTDKETNTQNTGNVTETKNNDNTDNENAKENTDVKDKKEDKIVIGVSMNALDEYQTEWYGYLEEYAKELGVELIMTNAEGKVDKQLADIESLIALNPDAILIRATDSSGVVAAFEACEAAGIPTLDSGFGSNYENTLKILSSQFYLCSLQAQYCIDWLKAHPDQTLKVGYVWGAQGVSAVQDRYNGWHDTLMEAMGDRVEILAEKVCNWSATETMAVVEDWVQAYPEMNCIVAMSDEMALAAVNVLQAANIGPDKCFVVGIDGSPAAQEAIRNGTLNATVYTSKKADARLTLEYAVRIAEGQDLRGVTIDPGNEISGLMTIDTIDELLGRLG